MFREANSNKTERVQKKQNHNIKLFKAKINAAAAVSKKLIKVKLIEYNGNGIGCKI